MSTYQAGSVCEDCLSYGQQSYLKPFYINMEEQIIKCESSRCMFPYIRRTNCSSFPDSKPSESILSLDELIEEGLKQIDGIPAKSEPQQSLKNLEDEVSIMFDFSSLFMSNPVQTEEKPKPIIGATTMSAVNPLKTEDVKSTTFTKAEAATTASQLPAKARISRCLSDVKRSSFAKKSDSKKTKPKRGKHEPVLLTDPQTGKPIRPLDLIKFYMKPEPR